LPHTQFTRRKAPGPAAASPTGVVSRAGEDGITLIPIGAAAKAQGVRPQTLSRRAKRGQLEGAVLVASRWYVPSDLGLPPAVCTTTQGPRTDPDLLAPPA
jgi:hypothetical protein